MSTHDDIQRPIRVPCGCTDPVNGDPLSSEGTPLHMQAQDTDSPAWHQLLELIEETAADGRPYFSPANHLGHVAWSTIVTLPDTIAKLTRVTALDLRGCSLLRIPPAIGGMESLESIDTYTSYALHWYPYEITRCAKLRSSTVSTSALYGNRKNNFAFPPLPDRHPELAPPTCSVCNGPFEPPAPFQVWTYALVATDPLPLLVRVCSPKCGELFSSPEKSLKRIPRVRG